MALKNAQISWEALQCAAVLACVADSDPAIARAATATLAGVCLFHRERWPDALESLCSLLDRGILAALAAADALCEDGNCCIKIGTIAILMQVCKLSYIGAPQLEEHSPASVDRLLDHALTVLNTTESIQIINMNPHCATALRIITHFLSFKSDILFARINPFMQSIYLHVNDQDPRVRQNVCLAFVSLAEVAPELLVDVLPDVVSFMLFCTSDNNPAVALEASIFWLVLAEQDQMHVHLESHMKNIMPVLMAGIIYTAEDIEELTGLQEDAHIPDNVNDIKPRHHKGKNYSPAEMLATEGMDQDSELDDGDDDLDDEDDQKWNVRKYCASALDVFATVYGDDLLPDILPHINTLLFHQNWVNREAGILALGAISEGCPHGMNPYLPTIVPLLLKALHDPNPLVKSITCWTFGRYSGWIVPADNPDETHLRTYFYPLVEGVFNFLKAASLNDPGK